MTVLTFPQPFLWLFATAIWCHVVLLYRLLKMQKIQINFPHNVGGIHLDLHDVSHRSHMGTW